MAQRIGHFTWRASAACLCALALNAAGARAQLIANPRPSHIGDASPTAPVGGAADESAAGADAPDAPRTAHAGAERAPAQGPPIGHADEILDEGAVAGAGDDASLSATPQPPQQETRALGAVSPRTGVDAETAPTPVRGGGSQGVLGSGFVRGVGSLLLVVGLIFGAWMVVRRVMGSSGALIGQLGAGGRAPSGLLMVLGRYPVARGQTLVLLKLDRRVLLLSQTSNGFQTLSELTDPEEVASILVKARDEEGDSMAHKFRSLLKSAERDPAFGDESMAGLGLRGVMDGGAPQGPTTVRGAWSSAAAAAATAAASAARTGPLPFGEEMTTQAGDELADAAGALRRRLNSLQGRTA